MYIALPFTNEQFSKYQFQSPREFKYDLSECIHNELFIGKLLKVLQCVNKRWEPLIYKEKIKSVV